MKLDPYDYAFQDDPYPVYAALREHDPLHHNPDLDLWALVRHEDIAAALKSDATYSNSWGVAIEESAWGPDAHKVMSILGMDPPRQNRLRALVSRGFTPRRVQDLMPRIQALTDRYLGECLERGSIDWIADFAGKLPMDVISEMMGVPEEDRAEVRRQADIVVHREDGVYDVPPAGAEASLWLVAYYQQMVDQRRRQPSDDLTSALIAAELDGERLTDEDVIAFLFLMVVAGNETTTKLLGHAVYHLTRHPAQLEQVFGGPGGQGNTGLVASWIEETLRFDTSSQLLARYLLHDVELYGRVAPAGSKLLLCLGSANRDERVFTRPAEYDIDRDPDELAQLLSFGGGRHFCLGANLARLEARIALTALVERTRTISVDHDASRRVHSVNVRGFAVEPMTLEVR
ncbi:MAG TPA: cytochrome P450 [Nocardioides bacterium]|uniref:cytochrome P450 n=1 Tax=uncultured Nocardioides sp. TaxID=198441 RepID=UPI000EC72675|nr:cytochrome P450 [uncultured Nocardioides sp.]HCB03547.1 cytochrome P450 [Nocardioides sp.]HRD63208.1 cytochrome P450 [Nocardioides sp.]HRK47606.1 cytochrome P450 [Nocardioides sp.]